MWLTAHVQTRHEEPRLAPDEEDMSQMEEHEYYNGLIIKIGARCFFCNQEGHFRMIVLVLGSGQGPESPQT